MELGSDLVIIASTIGDPMSHHWRSAVGRPDAPVSRLACL